MVANPPQARPWVFSETQPFWHPLFRAAAPLVAVGGAAAWFWRAWTDAAAAGGPGSGLGAGAAGMVPTLAMGAFVAFAAAAVAMLYLRTRLEVRVFPEEARVEFFPFARRVIPRGEIRSARVRGYRPRRDYGGWGVRRAPGRCAFHVSGNRGVEIELRDGFEILIGSERPEELVEALRRLIASTESAPSHGQIAAESARVIAPVLGAGVAARHGEAP